MKTAKAATDADSATTAKFAVPEEAAREVFRLRSKPARKAAGLLITTSF
jgi:hypothetical protein